MGDGGAGGARANNNVSVTSEANTETSSGSDIQTRVYGPQQFTEADVLACVKEAEEEQQQQHQQEIKQEMLVEEADKSKKHDEQDEEVGDNIESLKAKLRMLEDHTKCSKCMVSVF